MLVVHGNHVKIVAFGIGETKDLGNELALASERARETKSETTVITITITTITMA